MKFLNHTKYFLIIIGFAATAKIAAKIIFSYHNKNVIIEPTEKINACSELCEDSKIKVLEEKEIVVSDDVKKEILLKKKKEFEAMINNSPQLINLILRFEEFTEDLKQRLEKEDLFFGGLMSLSILQDFETELVNNLGPTKGINFVTKRIKNLMKIAEKTMSGLVPGHEINKINKKYISEEGRQALSIPEKVAVLRNFLKYIKNELSFVALPGLVEKGNYVDGLNQLEILLRHELPPLLSVSEELQKDLLKLIKFAHKQGELLYSQNNVYRYEKKLCEIISLIENLKEGNFYTYIDQKDRVELRNLNIKLNALFHQRLTTTFPATSKVKQNKLFEAEDQDALKITKKRILKAAKTNFSTSFRSNEKATKSLLKAKIKKTPKQPLEKKTKEKKVALPKEKKEKVVKKQKSEKPLIIKKPRTARITKDKK